MAFKNIESINLGRVGFCLTSDSCPWDLFVVQVAGEARQARPQSRPRYFWAHSETKVRLCCPHLNPLGRGGRESFARLALTRVPSLLRLVSSWASSARSLRLWRGPGRFLRWRERGEVKEASSKSQ
jgi:hypothetical protein